MPAAKAALQMHCIVRIDSAEAAGPAPQQRASDDAPAAPLPVKSADVMSELGRMLHQLHGATAPALVAVLADARQRTVRVQCARHEVPSVRAAAALVSQVGGTPLRLTVVGVERAWGSNRPPA